METSSTSSPITDEWCVEHFDYLSPDFARELHPTLARMRALCPVAHSDQYQGYWIATKYEDVLRVAQDWETFSSELGVSVPATQMTVQAIPEHVDPPLHRVYKRLINAYFTPAAVAPYEAAHPGARHPSHRRLHRGRNVRLPDRLRAPVPGPGLLRPRAERPVRPAERDQRPRHQGVGAEQPRRQGVLGGAAQMDRGLRRAAPEPAAPRRRRRRHLERRDRGASGHRRRDPRVDPAADPRRTRDHRGRPRALHDPVLSGAGDPGPAARASPSWFPTPVEELLRLEGLVHRHRSDGPARRRDRRPPDQGGREGPHLLGVGQSGRGRVPRCRLLRPRPHLQPAHRLRCGPAPVRRLEPGPPEPAGRGSRGGATAHRPQADWRPWRTFRFTLRSTGRR